MLDELTQAAVKGPEYLSEREENAFDPACDAIRDAANIQTVARQRGITDPLFISRLEDVAVDKPGYEAIDKNEYPQDVADSLGIADPDNIAMLTYRAAYNAVKRGENVLSVAAWYEITDQGTIDQLEMIADLRAG